MHADFNGSQNINYAAKWGEVLKIGIIDAELITGKQKRFPNTASMRISGYHKSLGDTVVLIRKWEQIKLFDLVYISKVFTDTKVPEWVLKMTNVIFGGTGFYYPDEAPALPGYSHNHYPDYHLYDEWVTEQISKGKKKEDLIFYTDASIGKLTDGCFMGCDFCVNKHKTKVVLNARLEQFYDHNRKIIILLDDQFLGYDGWEPLLDELNATGKPFQFRQGLDIRVLDSKKAKKLANSNYYEDFIFAFDNINQSGLVKEKLALWRKHTDKRTKLYVFCGFDKQYNKSQEYPEEFWINDLSNMFARVFILAEYDCTAYIMRHMDNLLSPKLHRKIYTEAASWTIQQWPLRTMSFRQYCIGRGMGRLYKEYKHDPERYLKDGNKKGLEWVAMEEFENKYPQIAAKYFDKQYKTIKEKVA